MALKVHAAARARSRTGCGSTHPGDGGHHARGDGVNLALAGPEDGAGAARGGERDATSRVVVRGPAEVGVLSARSAA